MEKTRVLSAGRSATPSDRATPDSERIPSLDALRGLAALGILVMNIQSFAMPESAYINPSAYGSLDGANGLVWLVSHLLADRKFMALFSMLFGAGLLLFSARVEARGRHPGALHVRRMLWLFVFGLLHAYLLWYGDILVAYAACGLLVYPLRGWSPRRKIAAALLILAVGSGLGLLAGFTMPAWPAAERERVIAENWSPPRERIEEEIDGYRGAWADQFAERVPTTVALETEYFAVMELWRAAGFMLIGMSLFQWGVFSATRSSRFYLALLVGGAAVSLPLTYLGARLNQAHGWDASYSMFFGWQINYWASLPMALAWTGLVMWLMHQPALRGLARPLIAVGRMAFTNYILETVICTTIFYGHGLGLFGRVDRIGQAGIVVVVWIVVIVFSMLWMRWFRYGPLEWLWRSLTYGVRPAIRRKLSPRAISVAGAG